MFTMHAEALNYQGKMRGKCFEKKKLIAEQNIRSASYITLL